MTWQTFAGNSLVCAALIGAAWFLFGPTAGICVALGLTLFLGLSLL